MRVSILALLLILAIPAVAADRTETIPLRFISVVELERLLDHAPAAAAAIRNDGPGDQRGLMPGGISAWTVDATRNRLAVTGSDEAIRELNGIVALLDVPPRQIRLSASVMLLDADAVRKL